MSDSVLQSRIDAIIASASTPKATKRHQLSEVLADMPHAVYIDLDDTLLAESSTLSTRFIVCAVLLRRSRDRIAATLPRFATLNDDFLSLHKTNNRSDAIVLTRNNHRLASAIIAHIQHQCEAHGITIHAVIGSDYTTDWRLMSRDKYALMPHTAETVFVTDNAEHHDDARPGTIIVTPGLPHLPLFARKVRIGLLTILSGLMSRLPGIPSIQQRSERHHSPCRSS